MNIEPLMPQVEAFRGVFLGASSQAQGDASAKLWRLSDGESVIDCLVPRGDLLDRLLSEPLICHWYQVASWPGDPIAVLTDAWEDENADLALHMLPPETCPVDGVFEGTIKLMDSITIAPLRHLVERIFLRRDVADVYWTTPASSRHHHAFPGGLAAHSLEVAEDLAAQDHLDQHERDLCIAAGLLHDVGKVWAYAQDMTPNPAARAMGHELLGLSRLESDLEALEERWPDGAYAMRVLLSGSGRMRRDGSMPSALLARLKAADQRSCEQERSRRLPKQVWTPGQWEAATPSLAS